MASRSGLGPSCLLLTALTAMAVGCSAGDGNQGFTGLTFGPGAPTSGAGPSSADGASDGTGEDSDTELGTGDAGSGDGPGPGSADGPGCTPSEEVCDGVDNDCDGTIDNDNPEGGAPCETGMTGVCSSGTTVCEDGAIACAPETAASAELCNGLDDDCNGMIDDGNPEGGEACNTGMPGVCADGTSECMVGVLACIADSEPSAEVCDNQDNDCNGTVDDDNPEGGGACTTGMPGICSAGTMMCNTGVLGCEANEMAATEENCNNGLDDDCNGSVDDNCSTCVHDICLTGVALDAACDPCVSLICAGDLFCCNTMWDGLCVTQVTSVCGIACP